MKTATVALVIFAVLAGLVDADCRNLKFLDDGLKTDKALVNHTIANITVKQQRMCRVYCFQNNDCVSFNTGPTSSGTNFTCELKNTDARQYPLDLKVKKGFIYREISNNPCQSNPCYNNGTCQAGFGKDYYRCVCPANRKGKKCDIKIVNAWVKVNTKPVCIGAKDDSYGVFNASLTGELKTIKLSHISGGVANGGGKDNEGNWGSKSVGKFEIHITDVYRNRLAPPKSWRMSYSLEGQSYNGKTLIFPNFNPFLTVKAGQIFWGWFNEDLENHSEDNNSGPTCADVFMFYATTFSEVSGNEEGDGEIGN